MFFANRSSTVVLQCWMPIQDPASNPNRIIHEQLATDGKGSRCVLICIGTLSHITHIPNSIATLLNRFFFFAKTPMLFRWNRQEDRGSRPVRVPSHWFFRRWVLSVLAAHIGAHLRLSPHCWRWTLNDRCDHGRPGDFIVTCFP